MDKWEILEEIIINAKLEVFGEKTDYNKGFITGLKYVSDSMENLDIMEQIMEGEDEQVTDQSH